MIAGVRGEVLDIALDHAVIEAAGVGYKVMCTPSSAPPTTLKLAANPAPSPPSTAKVPAYIYI